MYGDPELAYMQPRVNAGQAFISAVKAIADSKWDFANGLVFTGVSYGAGHVVEKIGFRLVSNPSEEKRKLARRTANKLYERFPGKIRCEGVYSRKVALN